MRSTGLAAEALMAFRDNATDDDGEPTPEHVAGALLLAEATEHLRGIYRALVKS